MRTTLTIDDELVRELKTAAARSGRSFKEVVNQALRLGLAAARSSGASKRYRLKPASLGGPNEGYDLDKALAIADDLEDEAIVQKLTLRK